MPTLTRASTRGVPLAWAAVLLIPFAAHAATPRVHAIVGARIVTAPGQVIPRGTIVIRDGLIVAVGASVKAPADARVWQADSLTVYPGMIDAFVMPQEARPEPAPRTQAQGGRPARPVPTPPPPARGPAHELASVTPEACAYERLPLASDQLETLRGAGFTLVQVAPREGIVRGRSAVLALGDGPANRNLVRPDHAQVIALEPQRATYPGSLMGAIAVVRQALVDARWYRQTQATYRERPLTAERPVENRAWAALGDVVSGSRPAVFLATDMLEVLEAAAIAKEAGITAQVVGAGDEYKRVREIAATGLPLAVPVDFPEAPDVADPALAVEVTTEQLRHWNQAPENPGVLAKAGVRIALTANGLKDAKQFRGNVARAIDRGLAAQDALAAVTTTPAAMLGIGDRLGTIAPGKIANLTVTHGELFSEQGKVREVWIDGYRYETAKDEKGPRGAWSLSWNGTIRSLEVEAGRDTVVKLVAGTDTLAATQVRLDAERLRFQIRHGSERVEDFDLATRHGLLTGTVRAGASSHPVSGSRSEEPEGRGRGARAEAKGKPEPIPSPAVMGNTEPWRMAPPAAPAVVFVHDATVWTAGPAGTMESADLLVRNGKVAAVGKNLKAPAGAVVIEGTGKHVAPGILDAHSHSAILGNVNECTHSVTAEVRVQDVINSESVHIYRQLAGGTTVMHLLHGSCNAIGGQCAVIKNRWGEPPDRLLLQGTPPTIKFALGENPKQSNWGAEATGRYPQSRAGVEQVIRDAFTRARDYRDGWGEWHAKRRGLPPRRDLQLDALVEILEGRRMIHSHAYRQDEILMLMRVAEEFGFKVQTFQHVLEGYKVADEMAAHGASGSTFSDWWGYKFEVIDAIPYAGYLMWDRGVTVSYNSDDSELARRLNAEAAKAVRYGGVPPEEAIRFVTLNPARQLGIDDRVGSLEPGKDADFTIWNGSPLSPLSRCEQTWIDGRKYFDREQDLAGREALAKEREALLARARGERKRGEGGPLAGHWPPRYLEDTDLSGNGCGGEAEGHGFLSETERRALQHGEVRQ